MMHPLLVGGLALAAGAGALIASILSIRRVRGLEHRLEMLLAGKNGESLERVIAEQGETLSRHGQELHDLVKASEYLHRAIQTSLRKVAFERYNPFPGVGGNQSFTLVMLDAFNSGVALTSLHNRDSTRVYAKGIRNGKALQNLSEEEHRVFQNALLMKGA